METLSIHPASGPITGVADLPGSKSITNRALALAALANGTTVLSNALFADDTARMQECLQALGFTVLPDEPAKQITVTGQAGKVPAESAALFVGNSGTTARFITPLAALGHGEYTIDGVPRMRERPIADLLEALNGLGVRAESIEGNGCPPVKIYARGLHAGTTTVRADISSQFLSGLLLAAPCAAEGDGSETVIHLEGPVLSAPYIEMTVALVREFGGIIHRSEDGRTFRIPAGQTYHSTGTFPVEPDASAASYFWAAAALTGGHVRINGLGTLSVQGDTDFVRVLEAMGCTVHQTMGYTDVRGPEAPRRLRGVTWDMNAISDTVMTLAALAPFADSPTVIENVAHIRHKETDRLHAVATELDRLGVRVEEREDGLTIYPAEKIQPATIQTYDDHRMAMAFSLIGLAAPGVVIADPACVGKTFPGYFTCLTNLVAGKHALPGE
ncbi:MAG: 3-phosphoshikimate 1-carboxyvinyltransferase [Armatimonadaceae bacterium]